MTALQVASTIIGPWLPYAFAPKSSDGLNPNLLGMWQEKYQYPDRTAVVGFEGTTQFFANKTYRVSGLLNITLGTAVPRPPVVVSYDFIGNGEWQSTDEELVTKLLNVRTKLVAVSITGKPMSIPVHMRRAGDDLGNEKSEIEQRLLLAQSQRYDIRKTAKNEVILETNGLYADSFLINMTRTDRMYMR
ncbi:hypothetical protein NLO83_01825 [Pseudomonas tremae]|uniref:hypothetical protein n=1 Tax=Pseudomonas syringae group TaxID=136849 RepID=UPI0001AF5351|nr:MULTISPECIES: hypothetical protein [Pseudomonas syringae group]MCQ3014350.1 hypothetical protein [Pseudomonas tremae]QGL57086.1 hypothetical protein POR16_12365 [Pseudomonas coronafaciens pv. oryzae str. 1_6]